MLAKAARHIGNGEATGIGMKTTGVTVDETPFQTKPFPIRSILLYEEEVESEFTR